jgi:hypothetical protein
MGEHIVFSNVFKNKILTKYLAEKYEGLCYIELEEPLIEQIRIMRDLSIVGSGHINGFHSVQATLGEEVKLFFMIPNLDPEYLSSDKYFLDTYYLHALWYPIAFAVEKIKADSLIPCEGAFIEVSKEWFSISVVPYENKYFSSMAFSNKIGFESIGL